MNDLASMQRTLQRLILDNAQDTTGVVRTHGRGDAAERLHIYASAYRLRLEEALAANYPMLQTHLGPQAFVAVALEYLDGHPSTYVSIRTFGNHLAQWLAGHRANEPWLAELARLEWALGCAFDARDAAPIDIESLAAVGAEDWSILTFRFSAAVQRLSLTTNAPALYQAATDGQSTPAGHVLPATGEWLVWRTSLQAHYRSLAKAEAIGLDTLLAGGTFADACERLAEFGDEASVPAMAAAFLKRWLLDEHIVELVLKSE
jgi:hypothetical protein